jgi:hypothetical protein
VSLLDARVPWAIGDREGPKPEEKADSIMRARALSTAPHPLDLALADAQTQEDIAQALADVHASWQRWMEARQRGLAGWLRTVRRRRATRQALQRRRIRCRRLEARLFRGADARAIARGMQS